MTSFNTSIKCVHLLQLPDKLPKITRLLFRGSRGQKLKVMVLPEGKQTHLTPEFERTKRGDVSSIPDGAT